MPFPFENLFSSILIIYRKHYFAPLHTICDLNIPKSTIQLGKHQQKILNQILAQKLDQILTQKHPNIWPDIDSTMYVYVSLSLYIHLSFCPFRFLSPSLFASPSLFRSPSLYLPLTFYLPLSLNFNLPLYLPHLSPSLRSALPLSLSLRCLWTCHSLQWCRVSLLWFSSACKTTSLAWSIRQGHSEGVAGALRSCSAQRITKSIRKAIHPKTQKIDRSENLRFRVWCVFGCSLCPSNS